MMQVSVLETSSNAWHDVLQRCRHDCYHMPGWLRAAEHGDGGVALAVHATDGGRELLLPLLRRDINGRDWDAISPYGYGGPVVSDDAPQAFVDAALQAAMGALRELGCVACFLRLHPIVNAGWRSDVGVLIAHGETISVDLGKDEATLWRETSRGHRREITRALEAGVTVRLDETFETLPEFIRLYKASMDRVGATDYYYFGDDYYYLLARELGPRMRLFVAEEAGSIIGAILFSVAASSGIMQGHLFGVDNRYLHRQPCKVILHAGSQWGRAQGLRYLHLGGGIGGSAEDSLFRFKLGFSRDTHTFRTQRLVVDAGKYAALCGAAAVAGVADLGGFFPAYRRLAA
jgi:hypothetical protein